MVLGTVQRRRDLFALTGLQVVTVGEDGDGDPAPPRKIRCLLKLLGDQLTERPAIATIAIGRGASRETLLDVLPEATHRPAPVRSRSTSRHRSQTVRFGLRTQPRHKAMRSRSLVFLCSTGTRLAPVSPQHSQAKAVLRVGALTARRPSGGSSRKTTDLTAGGGSSGSAADQGTDHRETPAVSRSRRR